MENTKRYVSIGFLIIATIGCLFLAVKLPEFVSGNVLQRASQEFEENYKKTHVYLPAKGMVVNKTYTAQHTDYIHTLFFSDSFTTPESYTISLQTKYKGKKITGDYTATEDEYKAVKVGDLFQDPIGRKMWFDLPDS